MGCDFSFIHAADLHLGSRFKGLSESDPSLGERLYEGIFSSFGRIVDAGRDTDFMVIAGDLFDEAFMTPRTKHRFCEEAARYGKPIFIVKGNHDFGDRWESTIPYPPNVTLFPTSGSSSTMEIRGRTVEVTGISYAQWHTPENLALRLKGSPDAFTIGLLHCSVSEVAESRDYCPCSVNDLLGRNIDYWALGHIHKRTVVRESSPPIVYPGNIQGRNVRECSEKGCYLVSVTGPNIERTFLPTQEIVFEEVIADITGKNTVDELAASISVSGGSVLSVTFTGRGKLDAAVRADPQGIAESIGRAKGCRANLASVRTLPEMDLASLREGETLMSEILKTSDALFAMSDEQILDLLCRGPAADVRQDLAILNSDRFRGILQEAVMSLLSRIEGGAR